jgi:hypothetical protein
MWFFIIGILIIYIFHSAQKNRYNKSKYEQESRNNFFSTIRDKGKYGEYLSSQLSQDKKTNFSLI